MRKAPGVTRHESVHSYNSFSNRASVMPIDDDEVQAYSRAMKLLIGGGVVLVLAGVAIIVVFSLVLVQDNVQFGIMIDAGSSGTRAYVYSWNKFDSQRLPRDYPSAEESNYKITPGIADFANRSQAEVDAYLEPMLSFLSRTVPAKAHSCTPLSLLATAGMRLLPSNVSEVVLRMAADTFSRSNFASDESRVRVINGTEEALFTWLDVNHVLGTFAPGNSPYDTVGTMELGGASAQMAFVSANSSTSRLLSADNSHTVSLSTNPGVQYTVYTVSFLSYGIKQAVDKLAASLPFDAAARLFTDPCAPLGYYVPADDGTMYNGTLVNGTMGSGDYNGCYALVRQQMLLNEPCPTQPCSIAGTYQPALRGSFYAVDNFNLQFGLLNVSDDSTLDEIDEAARHLCSLSIDQFHSLHPNATLLNNCFASLYTVSMLRDGFKFPGNSTAVTYTGSTLLDSDVSWTFGAMMLESVEDAACPRPFIPSIAKYPRWAEALIVAGAMLVLFGLTLFLWAYFKRKSHHEGYTVLI